MRVSVSFAIVLGAYLAYFAAAVPWIEPAADPERQVQAAGANGGGDNSADRRLAALEPLFPPGSTILRNAKILESDQVKLILQDYSTRGDGTLAIRPCVIVFTPDGPAETAEHLRSAVVLEAMQGAVLEFDGPLDLRRAKIGRLVSGRLMGEITIRSSGRLPGPEDDLLVTTRDVLLTEEQISTTFPVEFSWGRNYGRGSDLRIKLLRGPQAAGDGRQAPNVAGVELFEVGHLEQLHLELPSRGPGQMPRAASAGRATSAAQAWPLDIHCAGPFRFDPVRQVATLEDRVDVLRVNANGPSDQLNCELLSIFFSRTRKPGGLSGDGSAKPGGSVDLEPCRLLALGHPVLIHAPSQDVEVRGEKVDYDLRQGQIALGGAGEVFLKQGPNEIHARRLSYQSAGPGRLGQVLAVGPGWLRGQSPGQAGQAMEARFIGELRVRPYEQEQVISLTGGTELNFGLLGRLTAAEIWLWLLESPSARGEFPQLAPDRMLARGQVRLQSPRLSGAVEELGVWFERQAAAAGAPRAGAAGPGRLPQNPPGGELLGLGRSAPIDPLSAQHFAISGRKLWARVLVADGASELSDLTVEDQVRLEEMQTAHRGERPVIVAGDRVQVTGAGTPATAVSVTGGPAHFEGRGLGLTAANINLNRGANRLWVDGPGRMDLALDKDLQGRPLAQGGALAVQWQRCMDFDGRTARFDASVELAARTQRLRTETLEVIFDRPIRFSDPAAGPQPQPQEIRCHGGTWAENESLDASGRLSLERMQVGDLTINLLSGDSEARGPGWLTSVRRGSFQLPASPGAPFAQPPAAQAADPSRLSYLRVRFQRSITGNVRKEELTFHEQVKTVYGPVNSWDAALDSDHPESLGPQGIVLSCDDLSVVRMPSPTGPEKTVEMAAQGNVTVEGQTFTARAVRMSFAEGKGLLILEGDGRSEAELFRQEVVGGPTSKAAARKILFWPATKTLQVDGARSLEISQFPGNN